jgi:hypothetical protein
MIINKIKELKLLIPKIDPASDCIDTKHLLSTLLHSEIWPKKYHDCFIKLLSKVDISQQLRTSYLLNWKKNKKASSLTEPWISITALLLCKLIGNEKTGDVDSLQLIKRANTLFKLLDITAEPWLSKGSSIRVSVNNEIQDIIENISSEQVRSPLKSNIIFDSSSSTKTIIPLTVLFWEGPIARAYLETMHSLGFVPEKIIHLVSGLDISHGTPVARWLPSGLRKFYAENLQKVKINYWPKNISENFPLLKKAIFDEIHASLEFANSTLIEANKLKNLSFYSDNVETILMDGLSDPDLHARFLKFPSMTLLYTGGGILPEVLLSIPQIRFIHIHPGFLPDIRGADCVLWSILLTGRPSATCFYMSPGIDTGDIIFPCWLPKVTFTADDNRYDLKTLYQAVFSFFDPWVRSYALRYLLRRFSNFNTMPATPQSLDSGTTYHFMHTALQKYPLQLLFP